MHAPFGRASCHRICEQDVPCSHTSCPSKAHGLNLLAQVSHLSCQGAALDPPAIRPCGTVPERQAEDRPKMHGGTSCTER